MSPGPSYRLLVLTSVAWDHNNIRHRAAIYFYDNPPAALGYVTNVDQPNFNGHYVNANFHKSDFWEMYDILRSEQPVYLDYFYRPSWYAPEHPRRKLTIVWLITGAEPIGEGPAEPTGPALPMLLESMALSEEESMAYTEERPSEGDSTG
jgi:hypothetical protein